MAVIYKSFCFVADTLHKGKKRQVAPVSMSASYTSTKAEEVVALIRRLHTLECWNPVINDFITSNLRRIADMMSGKQRTVSSRGNQWVEKCLIYQLSDEIRWN